MIANYVYDLAQLIEQLGREPVILVGHSLGGSVALRYAGLFPDRVARIVAIEGLGLSPGRIEEQAQKAGPDQWLQWIDKRRTRARQTRRHYPTIEAAVARMRERHHQLSVEQRSEEHTSELQSLMRISYAVFCSKKKTNPHSHRYVITR